MDTYRKSITPIKAVLLPFVTYLLTLVKVNDVDYYIIKTLIDFEYLVCFRYISVAIHIYIYIYIYGGFLPQLYRHKLLCFVDQIDFKL
jgi:hypothetical protein